MAERRGNAFYSPGQPILETLELVLLSGKKWTCANCHYKFSSELEIETCPRCTSRRMSVTEEKAPEPASPAAAALADKPHTPRSYKFYDPRIYGETKSAWKSFHAAEVKQCTKCGGLDFDMDWKHKEKTCRKCGEIYPLPRRMA